MDKITTLDRHNASSTLNGMQDMIAQSRRAGNTTRLIDNAVRLLFQGECIKIQDHHQNGTNFRSNEYLAQRIVQRMAIEHPGVALSIDKLRLYIKINNA